MQPNPSTGVVSARAEISGDALEQLIYLEYNLFLFSLFREAAWRST